MNHSFFVFFLLAIRIHAYLYGKASRSDIMGGSYIVKDILLIRFWPVNCLFLVMTWVFSLRNTDLRVKSTRQAAS